MKREEIADLMAFVVVADRSGMPGLNLCHAT